MSYIKRIWVSATWMVALPLLSVTPITRNACVSEAADFKVMHFN